jgi:type II secretory pathway predicted ATPase ExeA
MTKTKELTAPVEAEVSASEITEEAFKRNIVGEHLFRHSQMEELCRVLRAAISNKAIAMVSGPPGVGKTTAVRAVVEELPVHKYQPIYLGQDQSGVNVMRRFAHSLGIQPNHLKKRVVLQISQWLMDNLNSGGKEIVLLVDEAHLLDDATLQEFRLMTNANYDRESPLAVILLGQPSLRLRLKSSDFDALSQRIPYRYSLEGLDEDETVSYIQQRLVTAGQASDTFSAEACQFVFQACQGVPRRINNLCSLAMLKARSKKRSTIDVAFLKELADLD